jgi:hypothetical protein
MLIDLAKAALDAASWPTKISTGRLMYAVGDNMRSVDDGQADESSAGFLRAVAVLNNMDESLL